jgi:phenylpropionate dioxygenase-like ring-hydroxylating dioxygenase large terminal subunit
MLERFWHPVCTLSELSASPSGVVAGRLLGRDLAIARLDDEAVVALDDRCLHRSTRLSIGFADGDGLRCAYHGWKWDGAGHCIDIPAMPDGPIPSRAVVGAYSVSVAYDLVWVRIDDRSDSVLPACPAWGDPALRIVAGDPYTWPVGAFRRVENFVDLSHFAWVHVGTLGRRDQPVPPLPEIRREHGELRFDYDPPELATDPTAMYGASRYRMPLPCTVNIEFELASGATRVLWMTASPVDDGVSRSFWMIARSDAHDEPDEAHMAFQRIVLEQDEPVVCNQVPPELPLDPAAELSVRTDKVSIEYRRALRDLLRDAVPASPPAHNCASLEP